MEYELRTLLANLRKSIELWFQTRGDVEDTDTTNCIESNANDFFLHHIRANIVAILRHGLHLMQSTEKEVATMLSPALPLHVDLDAIENNNNNNNDDNDNDNALQKFINDFEWLSRAANTRHSLQYQNKNNITIGTLPLVPSYDNENRPTDSLQQFLLVWTLRNLKASCLSSCLRILLSDKELLENYYHSNSFMRNTNYAASLCLCLSAIELQQQNLLSQIKPELYKVQNLMADKTIRTKRSNSAPNILILLMKNSKDTKSVTEVSAEPQTTTTTTMSSMSSTTHDPIIIQNLRKIKSLAAMVTTSSLLETSTITNNSLNPNNNTHLRLFAVSSSSSSSSSLASSNGVIMQQPTTATTRTVLGSFISNSSSSTNTSAYSITQQIELINCDNIKVWTDRDWEDQQKQNSAPKQTEPRNIPRSIKIEKGISPINSFLASFFNTSRSTTPLNDFVAASSASTNPTAIDSTLNTIIANDGDSCHDTDITSSNSVFDAFLPKYGKKLRTRKTHDFFEDGISTIDQKYYECTPNVRATFHPNVKTPIVATLKPSTRRSQSLTAFLQMTQYSHNNTQLEKENAHFRISEAIISAIEHIKWAQIEPDKLHRQSETITAIDWIEEKETRTTHDDSEDLSLKNEELHYSNDISNAEVGESCLDTLSAETVGLTLISKFNEQHLPNISNLKWLIGDDDTPQNLLPMPENSCSEQCDDNIFPTTTTRGTKYWAPPRQQIIFTEHPSPNRKDLIQKQNHLCAGCGMRISQQHLNSFRYCTYLGKYHCTGCHRNQIAAIPAKVLQTWDFRCYPVSAFAYHLLEEMWTYPLFCVPDLNAALYAQSKDLRAARTKRIQLRFVKDFIQTCRFATVEQKLFTSIPDYICSDPDTWSMADFSDANQKTMQSKLFEFIIKCEKHIFDCVLCTARGFICEHCRNDEVLFPWQNKVYRCENCGACFHQQCCKSEIDNCCRCQRIKSRFSENSEELLTSC